MKIWELAISDIDSTSFRIPENEKVDGFKKIIDAIGDSSQFFKDKWQPLVLLKDEQKIDPDFFNLYDLDCLILSSIAKKLIYSTMDECDYEMLPFISDENEYFLFNCLKTIDCLNKEESIVEKLEDGTIVDYELLMFDDEKLKGIPVFRIPEIPYKIFITTTFKFLYDELDLKGIDFDSENIVYSD